MSSGGGQSRKARPRKEEDQAVPEAQKAAEEESRETDELLDEIDEVLEANAEEFVRSFIQKGGE